MPLTIYETPDWNVATYGRQAGSKPTRRAGIFNGLGTVFVPPGADPPPIGAVAPPPATIVTPSPSALSWVEAHAATSAVLFGAAILAIGVAVAYASRRRRMA